MATPMMPDAPEPQNRMMPPGAPQQPMQAAPGGPNLMQGAPPGAAPGGPPAPPMAPPDPKKVREAIEHNDIMIRGLTKLVSMPRGALNKKEVFDAASDMIAQGGFPSPSMKQELIAHLANMPDDDSDIRKVLSGMLGQLLDARAQMFRMMGGGAQ